jgi:RecA/RadA recombinase
MSPPKRAGIVCQEPLGGVGGETMGVLPPVEEFPRISTGSAGLDDILGGGLDANRLYLYEGRPGTGKTTATAGRSMA